MGVYNIAKELQFLNTRKFHNIFLGLGGFHLEKIVLASIGQFLARSGARDIFVTNELYGPSVADIKVMTGKDYAMSRDAMQTLHEAVSRVYFAKFEREKEDIKGKEIIREICGLVKSPVDEVEVRNKWNITKSLNGELKEEFEKFKSNREKTSENFKFWNIFLDKIMPVITD